MDRRQGRKGTNMDYWSYGLAALGIGQIVLTGQKKRIGWLLGLATSCLWVAFALTTKQYGFLISSAVFGTIHVRNWIKWGKDAKQLTSKTKEKHTTHCNNLACARCECSPDCDYHP